MRTLLTIAAVASLAACVDVNTSSDAANAPAAGGYTLEVRGVGQAHAFMITAPDGKVVGARAADGASALMDAQSLHAFAAQFSAAADAEPGEEAVSLRLPGVSISVSGGQGGDEESGRVSINAGGRSVEVNAHEGGPGDNDDLANVRISGVDEAEVREFIAKADELSPAVQAEMLAALGLE